MMTKDGKGNEKNQALRRRPVFYTSVDVMINAIHVTTRRLLVAELSIFYRYAVDG